MRRIGALSVWGVYALGDATLSVGDSATLTSADPGPISPGPPPPPPGPSFQESS